MANLYVNWKKAAKWGKLSRKLRGGYVKKTLALGFFQSILFLIVLPVEMAVCGIILTDLFYLPLFTMRCAWI
jgi:hypothetical protein